MDFIAAILELIAGYTVGNKNKIGFLLFIVTGLCWITYVFTTRSTYGLLVVIIPAMGMNVRNYLKWAREENEVKENQGIINEKKK